MSPDTSPPPPTADQLLQALYEGGHMGDDRGIGARHLAARLGCSERRVRHLVEDLRNQGKVIGGMPRTGYFVAVTVEQQRATVRWLLSRVKATLVQISRMSGQPLAELAGQLDLIEAVPPITTET